MVLAAAFDLVERGIELAPDVGEASGVAEFPAAAMKAGLAERLLMAAARRLTALWSSGQEFQDRIAFGACNDCR